MWLEMPLRDLNDGTTPSALGSYFRLQHNWRHFNRAVTHGIKINGRHVGELLQELQAKAAKDIILTPFVGNKGDKGSPSTPDRFLMLQRFAGPGFPKNPLVYGEPGLIWSTFTKIRLNNWQRIALLLKLEKWVLENAVQPSQATTTGQVTVSDTETRVVTLNYILGQYQMSPGLDSFTLTSLEAVWPSANVRHILRRNKLFQELDSASPDEWWILQGRFPNPPYSGQRRRTHNPIFINFSQARWGDFLEGNSKVQNGLDCWKALWTSNTWSHGENTDEKIFRDHAVLAGV
jgi:hypothetical protein